MTYCTYCILPDTRPGLSIGPDGVCSACRAHEERAQIDWEARRSAFEDLVGSVKRPRRGYDCVIPVSGGKDSTWQVVTCLEFGLHPIAVTWKPPARTEIGRRNLENLIGLGVDHMDFSISPAVEKKFLRQAFERYGATGIPMHMALFAIPLTVAVRFDIPLVVWGENSADEYAGLGDPDRGERMTGRWLKRFGVTHGTTAKDWISGDLTEQELTEQELTPYFGPTEEELDQKGIRPVFLCYYFPLDPARTFAVAQAHGFQASSEGPKTGYYDFADIDDEFISIHHWLKWYKFGITRLFDNLALEIRNGRMSRDEAITILKARGPETPQTDIETFCRFVGMTTQEFFEIAERFRNPGIWTKRGNMWVMESFLVPDWDWTRG